MKCDVCGNEAQLRKFSTIVGEDLLEINFCRECDDTPFKQPNFGKPTIIGTLGDLYRSERRQKILGDPRYSDLLKQLNDGDKFVVRKIVAAGLDNMTIEEILPYCHYSNRQTMRMILNGNLDNLSGLEEQILTEIEEALERGELL